MRIIKVLGDKKQLVISLAIFVLFSAFLFRVNNSLGVALSASFGCLVLAWGVGYSLLRQLLGKERSSVYFSLTTGFIILSFYTSLFAYLGYNIIVPVYVLAIASFYGIYRFVLFDNVEYDARMLWYSIATVCFISVIIVFPAYFASGIDAFSGEYHWLDVDQSFNHSLATVFLQNDGIFSPGSRFIDFAWYHTGPRTLAATLSLVTGIGTMMCMHIISFISITALLSASLGLGLVLTDIYKTKAIYSLVIPIVIVFLGNPINGFLAMFPDAYITQDALGTLNSFTNQSLVGKLYVISLKLSWGKHILTTANIFYNHSYIYIAIFTQTVIGILLVSLRGKRSSIAVITILFHGAFINGPAFLLLNVSVIPFIFIKQVSNRSRILIFIYSLLFGGFVVMQLAGGSSVSNEEILSGGYADRIFALIVFYSYGVFMFFSLFSYRNNWDEDFIKYFTILVASISATIYMLSSINFVGEYFVRVFMVTLLSISTIPLIKIVLNKKVGQCNKMLSQYLLYLSILCVAVAITFGVRTFLIGVNVDDTVRLIFLLTLTGVTYLAVKLNFSYFFIVSMLASFVVFGFIDTLDKYREYFIEKSETIVLSQGETTALVSFRKNSYVSDVFATNKHGIIERNHPGSSYLYAAISERSPLLEGYRYGEYLGEKFATIKTDNDSIFQSDDQELVKELCIKYNISYLLVEPSKKMVLEENLPKWLVRQPFSGTIRIYRVAISREDATLL